MDDAIGVAAPKSTLQFLSLVFGCDVIDVRLCMTDVDILAANARCSGPQRNGRVYRLTHLAVPQRCVIAYLMVIA